MTDTMKKIETCELCGKGFTRICEPKSYIGNCCFDCSFWLRKIEISDEDEARRVIVDGHHYRLGIDNSAPFRGFGGRKFTVVFHDGRVVNTCCLWHQGEVPERFRSWLQDNAVFVEAEERPAAAIDEMGIPF